MTAPKLHHYVPQFHLRRFADAHGMLWIWDRDRDRAFQTTPSNVAAETQFYRLTEFEELGRDPLTMEKQLSELEGEVAAITAQWLDWLPAMEAGDALPIPPENRALFSLYMAVQFLRTAEARDVLSVFAEARQDTPLSGEERRRLHLEMLWDEALIQRLAARFSSCVWMFAVNTTAMHYFTSDNPIAFRTADSRQWVKAGVLAPGVYAVFPLSPTIVMYAHPTDPPFDRLTLFADCRSPVIVDAEMVESENSGQVFMASRFVIADRNAFDHARAFAPSIGTDLYARSDGDA